NTFAQFFPARMPAQSCGSMNNVLLGGMDSRQIPERPFVHYETLGGGAGAGPNRNGADAIHTHMTNTLNTPIEVFERRFPITISSYRVRSQSKDHRSKYHGGLGIERHYTFEVPVTVTVIAERHRLSPSGAKGGSDGRSGFARLVCAAGNTENLPSKFTRTFNSGETLVIGTADGGSWGIAQPNTVD
ncbi:MAG: hydantoinase B/oxoprolinase family protein, partial [Bradymonadia bacterium]